MQHQKHFLLVDDDEEDLEILKEAIQEVAPDRMLRFARNGEDLMLQLNENLPDLIFLDINMPLKTGVECLREIRRHSVYSRLPVFMYSTTASEKYVNMAYEAGANLFLQKPSNYNELKKLLRGVLELDITALPPGQAGKVFYHEAKT